MQFIIIQVLFAVSIVITVDAFEVVYKKVSEPVSLYVYDYIDNQVRCLSHEAPGPHQMSEQTCIYLDNKDKLVFDYTKLLLSGFYRFDDVKDIRKILMIGLGGGVLLNPLQEICPHATIDVVEISRDVIDVARDYFFMEPTPNTRIHVEDGYEFMMRNTTDNYDLIIIDAYICEKTPSTFRSKQFLKSVLMSLTNKGVVLSNIMTSASNAFFDHDLYLWKATFGSFYGFASYGNFVLTGRKNETLDDIDTIIKNTQKINLLKYGVHSEWIMNNLVHIAA